MLHADSPVPLYKQLYNRLRGAIEGGQLRIGRQLPSERQLAAEFGISRLTARRALDLLEEEGYIQAYQGKGSYVAHGTTMTFEHMPLEGFTEAMVRQGLTPSSKLLNRSIVTVSGEIARNLYLDDFGKAVKIRRLRFINDLPVSLETAYLLHPLCVPLLEMDLEKRSMYRCIEEELRIQLAYASQTLRTALGQNGDLALLGLTPPTPVVQMRRQTYDSTGRVIEYVEVVYREEGNYLRVPTSIRDN